MKPTNHNCESSQEKLPVQEPHPWLQKHYQQKRERTVRLVKAAVDQLVKEGQAITIEAICHKSAQIDSEGRGVKKSAVLENQEAHAYYREHSASYRVAQTHKRADKLAKARVQAHPLRIDPQRNVERARYRYLQLTKPELVERLLQVQQAYADLSSAKSRDLVGNGGAGGEASLPGFQGCPLVSPFPKRSVEDALGSKLNSNLPGMEQERQREEERRMSKGQRRTTNSGDYPQA